MNKKGFESKIGHYGFASGSALEALLKIL